jgi:outer membrane protein assembly factor BamE (lipoprotein component of BamABCDE complex)
MKALGFALFVTVLVAGCARSPEPASPSPLTHGNVQLTLEKGVTTQNQVLEAFGPPNITTMDESEREVWTYQRHSISARTTGGGGYATVIVMGGSGGTTGFEQSSRTMTLIITFDEHKKVSKFRSMSTSF